MGGNLRLLSGLATLVTIAVPALRGARPRVAPVAPRPVEAARGRRGLLLGLPIGVAAVAAVGLARRRSAPPGNRGYQEVARWEIAGGEGRFIAIGPDPTPEELRGLGFGLREEFRRRDNAVVMVFDDLEAARQARRGSRVVGEERFQAALKRQRAMYLKSAARGEETLTIYDAYPLAREVIQLREGLR